MTPTEEITDLRERLRVAEMMRRYEATETRKHIQRCVELQAENFELRRLAYGSPAQADIQEIQA